MPDDPRATYPERVRDALAALADAHPDWTDVTIGKKLGITKSAVGQWRKGKAKPNPQMLFRLADLVGWSPRWLAMGVEPRAAHDADSTPPPQVLALAARIAALPPQLFETLRQTFGEPVPNERVDVFFPPTPAKSTKKHG